MWFVRQDRRTRMGGEDEPFDPGVVVDDVEGACGSVDEADLGVHELEVLGVADAVDDVAVADGPGRDAAERRSGLRIAAGVERDVMAAPNELLGDESDDQLGSPVRGRRDPLVGWSELGDAHVCSPVWPRILSALLRSAR